MFILKTNYNFNELLMLSKAMPEENKCVSLRSAMTAGIYVNAGSIEDAQSAKNANALESRDLRLSRATKRK